MYIYRSIVANLDRCLFDGNASGTHGAGAIYADGSTPTAVDLFVRDCIFRNNTGITGAVHLRKPGTTTLSTDFSNCLFHSNTGSGGPGAIGTESSAYNVNIDKCTFTLNNGGGTTKEAFQNNTGGTMAVTNSIVWGNPSNGTTNKEMLNTSSTGNISNSVFVVANNTGFTSGTGNSAVNPSLNGSYEPTSGTAAGYRIPSSVGGMPGDTEPTDEGGCASRGFSYPTPSPFCINPVTESGTIANTGGTVITNVASNDQVNGAAVVLGTNASVSQSGGWPAGISLNTSTGAVAVGAGTIAGVYTIDYQLCDVFTPPSCKTVAIQVTVTAAAPVELIHFSAIARDKSAILSWATASEQNNKGFEIERSIDGRNWVNIGFIAGKETTSIQQHYQFTDVEPASGANYYRLKQVDFNGQFDYTSIVLVQFVKENISASIFPNPVKEQLTLSISSSQVSTAQVSIFDHTGRRVSSFNIDTEKGANTKIIDTALLPEGIYFLQINNGTEQTELIKFVKL